MCNYDISYNPGTDWLLKITDKDEDGYKMSHINCKEKKTNIVNENELDDKEKKW